MDFQLKDKTIIVVGGGSGIGQKVVEKFSEAETRVYFTSRDQTAVDKTLHIVGGAKDKVSGIVGDATNFNFAKDVVKKVTGEKGEVDILVNNIGAYTYKKIDELDIKEWQEALNVNLTPLYYWVKEIIPHMKSKKGGVIINIASISGVTGREGMSHYSAAKGGVIALTNALAKELGTHNIRVNTIAPGNILTEKFLTVASSEFIEKEKQRIPLGHMGTPEDVAYAVLFFASPLSKFITGHTLIVDGGRILA